MPTLRERYGEWAVVVGAAQGIGAGFSRRLAAEGFNLVLVALNEPELDAFAEGLERSFAVTTRPLAGDVSDPVVQDKLRALLSGLPVGMLVFNAALSPRGSYLDAPLERQEAAVDLNIRALMRTLDIVVPGMASRGRGAVVMLSSLSGLQGTPMLATYAATKAFTLTLAEALWEEWKPLGVDVLAVLPGSTDTPGYRASAPRVSSRLARPMPVEPVVDSALRALGSGPSVVPGRMNRFSAFVFARLLPRRTSVRFMGRTMRAMYRDQ